MTLVHSAKRVEEIALFGILHAGGSAEIENRIAAGAERRALIRGRQKSMAVDRWARADAAFEQNYEARKILVLRAETV
jgi:hypothetical protein